MKYTDEEMKELAADLLAIDLGLPSVCLTCESTMQKLHKGD